MDGNAKNLAQALEECLICKERFVVESEFLKHLRSHKISQAEYFQVNHPRHDKLTGDIIKFKNREFYFANDFNEKDNLKIWLTNQTTEDRKEWCAAALIKRRKEKNIYWTPSQIELRTVMIPSINYLDSIFGDYYGLCVGLGYENKHRKLDGPFPFYPLSPVAHRIVIDTREQKPLKFLGFETIEKKLDEGDYGLEDESVSGKTRIERKSIADLFGTLSKMGFERFKREIERGISKNVKLLVLVEAPLDRVYSLPDLPQYKAMQIRPEYVLHQMRELIQHYPQIQFLFVRDRLEASRVTEKILQSRGEWVNYDVQLAYDTRKL